MVNKLWTYHIYQPFTFGGVDYLYSYGNPQNIADYCLQAQIVLYVQFKAMYEGFQEHMWEYYSGVLTWKSQSPWPTLRGALYDSYLEQTGGYWGVQSATRLVHVQWNLATRTLSLVNKMRNVIKNISIRARTFDFHGILYSTQNFSIPEITNNSIMHLPKIDFPQNVTDKTAVLFFRFEVFLNEKNLIDTSDYWQSTPSLPQDYTYLDTFHQQPNLISLYVIAAGKLNIQELNVNVTIRNSASVIAFFIRIGLEKEQSPDPTIENRILPVWYSINYISLLPGEEKSISMECTLGNPLQKLFVVIEGWNVMQDRIPVIIGEQKNIQAIN